MAPAQPWSRKWLVRALVAGVAFLAIWLLSLFGPLIPHTPMVQGGAAACLAICLVIAAVAFVFEVVRRVTSV